MLQEIIRRTTIIIEAKVFDIHTYYIDNVNTCQNVHRCNNIV